MQALTIARSLAARNHTTSILLADYDAVGLRQKGLLGGFVQPIVFATPPGTYDGFQVVRSMGEK